MTWSIPHFQVHLLFRALLRKHEHEKEKRAFDFFSMSSIQFMRLGDDELQAQNRAGIRIVFANENKLSGGSLQNGRVCTPKHF